MRGALLTLLATIVIGATVIGGSVWAPWESDTAERERAWVAAYVAWFDRVDAAIASNNPMSVAECERRFRARVGEPPTGRLEPAAEAAARSCAGLPSYDAGAAWLDGFDVVASKVTSAHEMDARPVYEADLSAVAGRIAGKTARVHCWDEDDWLAYSQQAALLYGIEFWPIGLATPASARIDLAHSGCEPLRSFYRSSYAPTLSTQSYELAEALVLLAHEAEHIRTPGASEAVVECHAMQRVRGLVRDRGHGLHYQAEMAGLAWEVGYPLQLDGYRTDACFSGGPLDLDADSKNWP